jgi:adenylate cyclase
LPEGERRLAAIMFTDVVGFTSLGQTNEALALKLLEEHRGIVRAEIATYRGTEVKTIGDAFLVEFSSALEAVQCAVAIQSAMRERNSSVTEGQRVQLRIGVHVGDVVHSQGDILGDAVNVSSRVEPLAPPGGVCISGQAYDHVRNKIEEPVELIEQKTLKNVSLPLDVYRIVMPWDMKKEVAELDSRRVAVLPLKNMSPDPNDEYFADGMTEELITSLSSVTELTVIARTSVMQYKDAPKRVADIGKELSVGTVIEGSVRKAGTKVRITVQMIDARNEGHLWAQNYDKQLDDVFTVQSEVAEKVAEALKVKLAESLRRKLEQGATADPEAQNLYLKGMFYWNKRTPESLKKAVDYFQQATARDPTFALGHAGLALAYNVMASNFSADPDEFFPKAKEAALRALSIDSDLAEAHAVLAAVFEGYDRDLAKAELEFKKAIELNPNYPSAHQWYAQLLGMQNRFEEAREQIHKALELSPLSLIINTNIADDHYYRGEYDEGIEQAKRVIDMDPNFTTVYPTLIQLYLAAGKTDEAFGALEIYEKMMGPGETDLTRAYVCAHAGKPDEARKILDRLEASRSTTGTSPFLLGEIRFQLGDNDRGFELVEEAYRRRDRYILMMGIEKELNGVRSDPRYIAMLQKVGLAGHLRP